MAISSTDNSLFCVTKLNTFNFFIFLIQETAKTKHNSNCQENTMVTLPLPCPLCSLEPTGWEYFTTCFNRMKWRAICPMLLTRKNPLIMMRSSGRMSKYFKSHTVFFSNYYHLFSKEDKWLCWVFPACCSNVISGRERGSCVGKALAQLLVFTTDIECRGWLWNWSPGFR